MIWRVHKLIDEDVRCDRYRTGHNNSRRTGLKTNKLVFRRIGLIRTTRLFELLSRGSCCMGRNYNGHSCDFRSAMRWESFASVAARIYVRIGQDIIFFRGGVFKKIVSRPAQNSTYLLHSILFKMDNDFKAGIVNILGERVGPNLSVIVVKLVSYYNNVLRRVFTRVVQRRQSTHVNT